MIQRRDQPGTGESEPRGIVSAGGLAAAITSPAMIVVLWLGVFIHAIALMAQLPARATSFDFSVYYASALTLREHRDPYTTDLDEVGLPLHLEIDPIHFATDPPTFLLLLEPLSLLTVRAAFRLWTVLNLAALVLSIALLLGSSGLPRRTAWAVAALAFLYPPVGEHFFYGQNKIFVLLMLVLTMRWLDCDYDPAAGLMLGIAALLRGMPILMVGYLLVQRRWRAVAWTAIGIAFGAFVTVAALGVPQTMSFAHGLRFVTKNRFLALPINISLNAFISRLFWYATSASASPAVDFIRRLTVTVGQLGLLILTIRATMRIRPGADADWRGYSLWVVTAVLLSPTAWIHYLVLALIPFIMMAAAATRGRASTHALSMAAASYLVIALSTAGRSAFGPHAHSASAVMVAECSFVSLAMVYLAVYWFATDPNEAPAMTSAELHPESEADAVQIS
jgi:Glycosyltransferase family 87